MRGDPLNKRRRSELMARVRSRGNQSTEIALMNLLRLHGISGWRRNHDLFGRPDFVFRRERVAVFVDGEFWHGHPTRGRLPKNNHDYWRAKIARNRARDRLVNRTLGERGWIVLRIWEHQLSPKYRSRVISRLLTVLARNAHRAA